MAELDMTKVDLRLYVEGSISVGKRKVFLMGRIAWREAHRNIYSHIHLFNTYCVPGTILRILYIFSIDCTDEERKA